MIPFLGGAGGAAALADRRAFVAFLGDLEHALTVAATVLDVERTSPRAVTAVRDAQTLANALMLNDATWGWVERVATALTKCRRLTGRQIAELRLEDNR